MAARLFRIGDLVRGKPPGLDYKWLAQVADISHAPENLRKQLSKQLAECKDSILLRYLGSPSFEYSVCNNGAVELLLSEKHLEHTFVPSTGKNRKHVIRAIEEMRQLLRRRAYGDLSLQQHAAESKEATIIDLLDQRTWPSDLRQRALLPLPAAMSAEECETIVAASALDALRAAARAGSALPQDAAWGRLVYSRQALKGKQHLQGQAAASDGAGRPVQPAAEDAFDAEERSAKRRRTTQGVAPIVEREDRPAADVAAEAGLSARPVARVASAGPRRVPVASADAAATSGEPAAASAGLTAPSAAPAYRTASSKPPSVLDATPAPAVVPESKKQQKQEREQERKQAQLEERKLDQGQGEEQQQPNLQQQKASVDGGEDDDDDGDEVVITRVVSHIPEPWARPWNAARSGQAGGQVVAAEEGDRMPPAPTGDGQQPKERRGPTPSLGGDLSAKTAPAPAGAVGPGRSMGKGVSSSACSRGATPTPEAAGTSGAGSTVEGAAGAAADAAEAAGARVAGAPAGLAPAAQEEPAAPTSTGPSAPPAAPQPPAATAAEGSEPAPLPSGAGGASTGAELVDSGTTEAVGAALGSAAPEAPPVDVGSALEAAAGDKGANALPGRQQVPSQTRDGSSLRGRRLAAMSLRPVPLASAGDTSTMLAGEAAAVTPAAVAAEAEAAAEAAPAAAGTGTASAAAAPGVSHSQHALEAQVQAVETEGEPLAGSMAVAAATEPMAVEQEQEETAELAVCDLASGVQGKPAADAGPTAAAETEVAGPFTGPPGGPPGDAERTADPADAADAPAAAAEAVGDAADAGGSGPEPTATGPSDEAGPAAGRGIRWRAISRLPPTLEGFRGLQLPPAMQSAGAVAMLRLLARDPATHMERIGKHAARADLQCHTVLTLQRELCFSESHLATRGALGPRSVKLLKLDKAWHDNEDDAAPGAGAAAAAAVAPKRGSEVQQQKQRQAKRGKLAAEDDHPRPSLAKLGAGAATKGAARADSPAPVETWADVAARPLAPTAGAAQGDATAKINAPAAARPAVGASRPTSSGSGQSRPMTGGAAAADAARAAVPSKSGAITDEDDLAALDYPLQRIVDVSARRTGSSGGGASGGGPGASPARPPVPSARGAGGAAGLQQRRASGASVGGRQLSSMVDFKAVTAGRKPPAAGMGAAGTAGASASLRLPPAVRPATASQPPGGGAAARPTPLPQAPTAPSTAGRAASGGGSGSVGGGGGGGGGGGSGGKRLIIWFDTGPMPVKSTLESLAGTLGQDPSSRPTLRVDYTPGQRYASLVFPNEADARRLEERLRFNGCNLLQIQSMKNVKVELTPVDAPLQPPWTQPPQTQQPQQPQLPQPPPARAARQPVTGPITARLPAAPEERAREGGAVKLSAKLPPKLAPPAAPAQRSTAPPKGLSGATAKLGAGYVPLGAAGVRVRPPLEAARPGAADGERAAPPPPPPAAAPTPAYVPLYDIPLYGVPGGEDERATPWLTYSPSHAQERPQLYSPTRAEQQEQEQQDEEQERLRPHPSHSQDAVVQQQQQQQAQQTEWRPGAGDAGEPAVAAVRAGGPASTSTSTSAGNRLSPHLLNKFPADQAQKLPLPPLPQQQRGEGAGSQQDLARPRQGSVSGSEGGSKAMASLDDRRDVLPQRERERDRGRDREREREREGVRGRNRETDLERDSERERGRDRERNRERERDREREWDRDRERNRERERDREREWDRDRKRERGPVQRPSRSRSRSQSRERESWRMPREARDRDCDRNQLLANPDASRRSERGGSIGGSGGGRDGYDGWERDRRRGGSSRSRSRSPVERGHWPAGPDALGGAAWRRDRANRDRCAAADQDRDRGRDLHIGPPPAAGGGPGTEPLPSGLELREREREREREQGWQERGREQIRERNLDRDRARDRDRGREQRSRDLGSHGSGERHQGAPSGRRTDTARDPERRPRPRSQSPAPRRGSPTPPHGSRTGSLSPSSGPGQGSRESVGGGHALAGAGAARAAANREQEERSGRSDQDGNAAAAAAAGPATAAAARKRAPSEDSSAPRSSGEAGTGGVVPLSYRALPQHEEPQPQPQEDEPCAADHEGVTNMAVGTEAQAARPAAGEVAPAAAGVPGAAEGDEAGAEEMAAGAAAPAETGAGTAPSLASLEELFGRLDPEHMRLLESTLLNLRQQQVEDEPAADQ